MEEGKPKALNQGQKLAVEHGEGPALVVAGAGTGKTQVITQRIARLIQQKQVEPSAVLALTFTEKAAREMAERLYDLIGWHAYQVPVMTFHAFGAELLGRYATHIGRSVRGGLLNDTQKALLLQQSLDQVELSYYGPHAAIFEFLEGVVRYIGQLQNAGISAETYAKYAAELATAPGDLHPQDVTEQQDLSKLYSLYEGIKSDTGSFDYNDQLQIPLHILQQRPNLAERLAQQYRYVLVDEYQDTNTVQDELLRAFIKPTGNLFAVGDDDQAIYAFRGAQINNILSFVDHFKVKQPMALTINYRSGQEILDAAHRLIQHNDPDRLEAKLGLDKRLTAQRTGSSVEFLPYDSAAAEIDGVVAAVAAAVKHGAVPDSLAVLAATHAPLKQIAKALRAHELPFALSTQVNIFEQPELNQLWYLLEWIGLRADEESIAHVMLSPFMAWSVEQYRQLLAGSREELNGVEDQLRALAGSDDAAKAAAEKLDWWRQWSNELPVSQLTYRLFFETGMSDRLIKQADDHPRIARIFEDLAQLLNQMQDYETVARDLTLTGYLKTFPKPPAIEVAEPMGDTEGVQLLTVHAAKGLEFDTVFLVGCTQRSWSPKRPQGWEVPAILEAAPELPPEHELRRLMYVAVTRAKNRLVMSAATQTVGGVRQTMSPFVSELLGQPVTPVQSPKGGSQRIESAVLKLQRFYPLKQQGDAKLPFETTTGWLELGVGAVGNYDFCPYDFYLEKVLGIRQPFGPQLAFGTALHGAIQAYYQAKLRSETITALELATRLDEQWSDRGYGSQTQAEQARTAAHQALANFLTREAGADDRQVIGSELPIKLEIPEAKLRLSGRVDALFQTPDGIELRDFKTGRKTNADALARAAKTSFQLRTYALAYEVMTGSAPHSVTLDYIVTGVEGRAELSAAILRNHREKLIKLAERIRVHDFAPNTSNVHQCAAIRYYGTGEAEELAGLGATNA
jgi:DNA helicase-2/ATP-dependent DNA helicase PcrA